MSGSTVRLPVGVQWAMLWSGMTALPVALSAVRTAQAGSMVAALLLGGSALLAAMFVVGGLARRPWSWSVGIASLLVWMVWELIGLVTGGHVPMGLFIRLTIGFLAILVLLRPSSRAALGAGG